jgi:hypothetical protein
MATKDIPRNWPDHLEQAVNTLNNRIIPHLRYSPNELLLGLVVNTPLTPDHNSTQAISDTDVVLQMAYTAQQHLDGYSQIVDHAVERKKAFDRKVQLRAPREVIFLAGQLVQVYRSDLDFSFRTERKMEPKWSAPRRVVSRDRNSYIIQTLEGLPIAGRFSSRRLRRFIPRTGTSLAEAQAAVEAELSRTEAEADIVPTAVIIPIETSAQESAQI